MKLPRTLHIEGSRLPVGESDPTAIQFDKLSGQFLVIEEKVDGTGVSISLDNHFDLEINHRGSPVVGKEFRHLRDWAHKHWEDLADTLGERYVLFGEWMFNKHTIFYDNLPHHFLESDVYDKERQIWLSTSARNRLLRHLSFIKQVPVIAAFKPSALYQITNLVGKTKYQTPNWKDTLQIKAQMFGCAVERVMSETDQSGMMEGLYIKQESDTEVVGRYKYIRHDFLQTILDSGTHQKDRLPVYNSLEGDIYDFKVGD